MTRRRYELAEHEWPVLSPLLPNKPREVPRVDDRRVLNVIPWRFRTGSPWAEIPERHDPPITCYNHFVRWRKAGVWDRLLEAVSKAYDGDILMIDGTCVRVHQQRGHGKKGDGDDGGMGGADKGSGDLQDRWNGCVGRPRGGLTSKIHARSSTPKDDP